MDNDNKWCLQYSTLRINLFFIGYWCLKSLQDSYTRINVKHISACYIYMMYILSHTKTYHISNNSWHFTQRYWITLNLVLFDIRVFLGIFIRYPGTLWMSDGYVMVNCFWEIWNIERAILRCTIVTVSSPFFPFNQAMGHYGLLNGSILVLRKMSGILLNDSIVFWYKFTEGRSSWSDGNESALA